MISSKHIESKENALPKNRAYLIIKYGQRTEVAIVRMPTDCKQELTEDAVMNKRTVSKFVNSLD